MTTSEQRLDALEQRIVLLERGRDRQDLASPPFDGRVHDADIRAAYRIFLHRDADAAGFDHFHNKAGSSTFGFPDLVNGLTDCEEYRQKTARTITTVDVDGVTIAVDPDEPEFGRAIARDGVWEPHVLGTIRRHLGTGDVFVDIGANVGVMSLHAAAAVGETGHVFAFEPNQDNVQRLLQGIVLNGFGNVTVYPFAASNASAIFAMQGSSNTHLVSASVGGRLAQSVRGDDILRSTARVDFVKIDIEGHEPFALDGLDDVLRRHKPMILCEFNPRCLRAVAGVEPAALAERVFALTDRVDLVEKDMSLTPCASAGQLVELWQRSNDRLAAAGELAEGMLHFDLLFRVT